MDKIQTPDWAKTEPKKIAYDPNLVIRYAFDGSDGIYRCGDREYNSLTVQPINYRTHYSERYGRSAQTWFDLAFADEDGDVAILSVNKQSAVELGIFFGDLLRKGIAIEAVSVSFASKQIPIKVISEEGTAIAGHYFAISVEDYDYVERDRFESVKEIQENFRWVLVGEVQRA